MNHDSKRLSCSYTVEASFLVPICTLVILFLITQALFYRDIVVSERVAASAAEQGAQYIGECASVQTAGVDYARFEDNGLFRRFSDSGTARDEEAVAKLAAELLDGKLWFATGRGVSAEAKNGKVTVRMTVEPDDRIKALFFGFGIKLFRREVSVTKERKNLPVINRVAAASWETGKKVKGLSEALAKAEELFGKLTGANR